MKVSYVMYKNICSKQRILKNTCTINMEDLMLKKFVLKIRLSMYA